MSSNESFSESTGQTVEVIGFGRRFVAYLIDSIVLSVMGCSVGWGISLVATLLVGGSEDAATGLNLSVLCLNLLIYVGYFVVFWATTGQTLGKMAMGIKVISTDGSPVSWGKALLRYIGYIVSGIPLSLGFIWAAFDAKRQGWHDKIASTYIVRKDTHFSATDDITFVPSDPGGSAALVIVLVMIPMVLGLVAAGGALYIMMQGAPPPIAPPPEVAVPITQVLVAIQNIPRGSEISADAVGFRDWPANNVPPDVVADVSELIGKVASTDIYQGQPIVRSMLAETEGPEATLEPGAIRIAPDGSGDYPDLKTAVDAVATGTTLALEPGTYHLDEPLDIDKSLRLVGAGMDRTEIVSEVEGYVTRFSGDGSFAAEGITFRHEGTAAADVVVVQGGEVALARCRFTGAVMVEEKEFKVGLRLQGSTAGIVRDCVVVENDGDGIWLDDQAQPTLEGNVCKGNKNIGISYGGNAGGMARQNECSGNVVGIAVLGQAQPTLEGNTCKNNGEAGIYYADEAGGLARQNECSGSFLGIEVAGQAQPTLEGNICSDNEKAGIIFLDKAGGVARQNECSGSEWGIDVTVEAQPTLEGNVCKGNEKAGIYFWVKAGGVARQNECSENEGPGIFVSHEAQPTLEGNVCTDNETAGITYAGKAGGVARQNECSENRWFGIEVGEEAQPTLEGNICTGNEAHGIGFFDNAGGAAKQNECSGNDTGIFVANQAQPTLEANVCADNKRAGIAYFNNGGGVARQNECSGNGKAGIEVTAEAQPTLEENICTDNKEAGIAFFDSAGGVAKQNECSGNEIHGIYITDQAQPTLEANVCKDNKGGGIYFGGDYREVARQNECTGNNAGIVVGENARPTLERNICTGNEVIGIGYEDNAGGVARQNECSGNGLGIGAKDQAQPTLERNECFGNSVGLYLAGAADPDLVDNNFHDNTEADVQDERP